MRLSWRPGKLAWRFMLYITAAVFVALIALLLRMVSESLAHTKEVSVSPEREIPHTDVNPYGANFFLAREVEPWKLDKTLQMAAEAGIGWVKQQFSWEEIEPQRKGEYLAPQYKTDTWAKYDQIEAACAMYNLQSVARLDRPPDWTRQDNTYKQRPPDNFEDYGDFVYAVVKRYEGRINYIQIWNEPNIFPEWGNQPVDPAQYVELLKIAYRRAKEANPNVVVLCAPLALTWGPPHPAPGKWIAMHALDYLKAMYQAGAKDYFDIYSANAFGMDRPPEDPPDPQTLNFQRVVLHRRIMEQYGDDNKAVWFNEYGWNAAPESMPAEQLIWKRVNEKQQAEYTLRGIELARREWPWAGAFMIWYFRQVGHIPADRAEYYFGMVDPEFTPRPVYLAVQEATMSQQRAAGPGYYQETNPSVKPSGQWQRVLSADASGGAYLRSHTPGDTLTFTFQGAGVDLVSNPGPAAGRLLVSLDGHTVAGLPTNAQGQSYLDLYNASAQSQTRLALVRLTTANEHVLRLTVADERDPASSGGVCVLDAFEVVVQDSPPFPAAAIAATVGGLALDGWLLSRVWRRVRWVWRAP